MPGCAPTRSNGRGPAVALDPAIMKSNDRAGVRLCVLVALALLASASMSGAQDKTALSISLSSTTVSPGETLLVTLRSPANVRFAVVGVIWKMGIIAAPTTLPATVPVHIPDDMRPGKYAISAMGRTVSNEQVTVVTGVVVERTGCPPTSRRSRRRCGS